MFGQMCQVKVSPPSVLSRGLGVFWILFLYDRNGNSACFLSFISQSIYNYFRFRLGLRPFPVKMVILKVKIMIEIGAQIIFRGEVV